MAVIWVLLMVFSRPYNYMVAELDSKKYYLKEVYPIGLFVLDKIKYPYTNKWDRSLRQYISILYGDKYAEYYLRIKMAQKISISFTVLIALFPIYVFADDITILGLALMFSLLAVYWFGEDVKRDVRKLERNKMRDFPAVIAKLALLTNAGLILREAWERVAYTGESEIYKEMQQSVDEIRNGSSDVDAYFRFGVRCSVPEIKRFVSSLVQSMTKGNQELVSVLTVQNHEIWEIRKQRVKQEGEKAASKLLIPIVIMFIGVLILIIVPIFSNLGV